MKFKFVANTSALLFFICIISCKSRKVQSTATVATNVFAKDSGYILASQANNLLLESLMLDSIDNPMDTIWNNTDTIGKYYKTNKNSYIVCMINPIEQNSVTKLLLAEFTPDGKIVKKETYNAGFHLCCWGNKFNGFNKHGKYYSLTTCGTGSGFCSGDIHIFKEVTAQRQGITATAWSTWCEFQGEDKPAMACSLTSTFSISSMNVTMHYKLEHLEPDESESGKYTVKNTEVFNIKYENKDDDWIPADTTYLYKIPQ